MAMRPVEEDPFEWILVIGLLGALALMVIGLIVAGVSALIKLIIGFRTWKEATALANSNYRIWANVTFSYQKENAQPTIKFQTYSHKLFEMVDAPDFWKVYVKYHFEKRYRRPFLVKIEGKII